METDRSLVVLTAAVVAALTLATGPTLGVLDVPDPSPEGLGSGSATVTIQSTPERATLEAGQYTDVHYLDVPQTTATVAEVTGSPILTLSLDVPELGFSRSSVYVLTPDMSGEHAFAVEEASIDSARVENETYDGTLQVVLRDGSGRTDLVEEPVTVEVSG